MSITQAIEAALARQDPSDALTRADAALALPSLPGSERAAVLALRSRAHEATGNLAAARVDLEGAIALAPGDARLFRELGIVCADLGDAEAAIGAFRHATVLDPRHARGFNNLGNALRSAGRVEEAAAAFAQAVALDSRYGLAWANLGAVLREAGDNERAKAALLHALQVDPHQRVALLAMAGLQRQDGEVDDAARLYRRALERVPNDAATWLLLGQTLAERDDLGSARRSFDAALQRDPAMLRASFARDLLLPMVPASADEQAQYVAGFGGALDALETDVPSRAAALDSSRAVDELRHSNFLLAYACDDDVKLQRRFARIVHSVVEQRASQWLGERRRRVSRKGRLRIGFASSFFRDGTVGRYFERLITGLPRDRFAVVLVRLSATVDALTLRLHQRADEVHEGARLRPSQLAGSIVAAELDVLVYPELGMDATAFALAALRLAPVQCVAWGHPVTTGHVTIDVFFSSAAMELADAQERYVERLVTLPGIGTSYARPDVPRDARRTQFGLPEGRVLFLCPQSLFKMRPDNDDLFARVLGTAPGADLVLFEGRHPQLTAKYLARLDRALAVHGVARDRRLHVLRQCGHDDYLRINMLCDAMLDTLHWSGGNTSLDAFACGLPIVTLPGAPMRSRQSAAMLELMGVRDTIATDPATYVRIASRLAADRAWREEISSRLVRAQDAIFEDSHPPRAFAEALERLA